MSKKKRLWLEKRNKKRVIVWLYVFVYKHVGKMFVATKKKRKKEKAKKRKKKEEKVCVSKHVEPVNLLNLNFTFGVYLFICWRIAVPLLANICSSVGEYLFLCWCISVPLLMYISASVAVYLFTCSCLSVHL